MRRNLWMRSGRYGTLAPMLLQAPHPYILSIDHCPFEVDRYRWEIRRGPRLIRSSAESQSSEQEAVIDGYEALHAIIAEWREGQGRQEGRRGVSGDVATG